MTTKPFSVRLSDSITKLVQGLSDGGKKTPSDFIREAVEEKISRSSDYSNRVVRLVMEPEKTIARIREKLNNQLSGQLLIEEISLPEISAMMVFWHKTYEPGAAYSYVNPRYVITLMDIVNDFLRTAHEENIAFDFHYSHAILGSLLGVDFHGHKYEVVFERLKDDFLEHSTIGWPDMLTRILSHASYELDGFPAHSVARIFTKSRVEDLFPVAVRGAGVAPGYVSSARNMQKLLPDAARFQIGDLKFAIYPDSFTLLVEGSRHCYALRPQSLLSLCSFSESDQFVSKCVSQGGAMKHGKLEVQVFRGDAIIHENNGYRLFMKEQEFIELLNNVKRVFADHRWGFLLKSFRNLNGDI